MHIHRLAKCKNHTLQCYRDYDGHLVTSNRCMVSRAVDMLSVRPPLPTPTQFPGFSLRTKLYANQLVEVASYLL